MKLIKTTLVFFILIALFISAPRALRADVDVQSTDIIADVSPSNPGPYTNVTITLSSYATDLSKAMIEWKSGDKIILSGFGKTSYSFKTLGPNNTTSFLVTVLPTGSVKEVTKVIAITPSDVVMLWQAIDGYTPPFYRGKSFISSEGLIKVVAMPNTTGTTADKNKMTYAWSLSDQADQNASGYGKDSYTFRNSNLNASENVSVDISSLSGNYSGTGSVVVPIVDPKIIFYKRSPTEGVLYENALGNEFTMTEDEATVVAEPYFLAYKGNENDFTYSWQINGQDIDTPTKKTELTIRPSSRGGYATVSATFENLTLLFQKVVGNLKIDL